MDYFKKLGPLTLISIFVCCSSMKNDMQANESLSLPIGGDIVQSVYAVPDTIPIKSHDTTGDRIIPYKEKKGIVIELDSTTKKLPFDRFSNVRFSIINYTDTAMIYEKHTYIEQYRNGKWSSPELQPNPVIEYSNYTLLEESVGAHRKMKFAVRLFPFTYKYPEGRYRVRKRMENILTRKSFDLTAEFEIKK